MWLNKLKFIGFNQANPLDKEYQKEIKRLKDKVNNLQEALGDPRFVVEKVLDGDIIWFDYKGLKRAERIAYWQNAQTILKNETFKNEIRHIYGDLIQHIAMRSEDFEEVTRLRMTINGVKLLEERLQSISKADSKPTNKEPFKEI